LYLPGLIAGSVHRLDHQNQTVVLFDLRVICVNGDGDVLQGCIAFCYAGFFVQQLNRRTIEIDFIALKLDIVADGYAARDRLAFDYLIARTGDGHHRGFFVFRFWQNRYLNTPRVDRVVANVSRPQKESVFLAGMIEVRFRQDDS